jgi:hypothetical protein
MGFDMMVSLGEFYEGSPPTASHLSDGKTYVPKVRDVVPFFHADRKNFRHTNRVCVEAVLGHGIGHTGRCTVSIAQLIC